MTESRRIACVVGLGIVGIPVAAKLAQAGYSVIGLDIDEARVGALQEGRYPMEAEEPGLSKLLAAVHGEGRLDATTDPEQAIPDADIVLLAVQTPTDADGIPRYQALKSALETVGKHLSKGTLVIVESTLAPGTMKDLVLPTLEATSGMQAGEDFHLGHCPERVMPGRLLQNLEEYDRVVGGFDEASTSRMLELYQRFVKAELHPTDMTTAEVVKTTENAYRDVEIAFANEVAMICEELGVDVWDVRDQVNRVVGRNMHMPGVGVGGHCIPKDGLLLASAAKNTEPRMLRLARRINDAMPEHTVDLVRQALGGLDGKVVTILGASYLPGSDDVRNTPTEPLADALAEAGATVRLHDPYVRDPVGDHEVSRDLESVLEGTDAVVLATAHAAYLPGDWSAWKDRMRTPVAIDGRGAWDPIMARDAGFTYRGIGR